MKKKSLVILGILMFAFVLVGCTENGDSGNDNGNGNDTSQVTTTADTSTLTIGFEGDIVSMDPHASNVTTTAQVLVQVFEPLVRVDPDTGDIIPVLAHSWERYDDYSYTFYLKEGVLFHDGTEMTAEDVVFSIGRAAVTPQVSAIMGDFNAENMVIIDDHTVRIGTDIPFAPLLNNISHPAGGIISRAAYEAHDGNIDTHPIGTGPFVLTSRVHGDRIEFERFEDFHEMHPHLIV